MEITPARANALRDFAAGFYHEQLLSSFEALHYQTEIRHHDIELLKRFRIGYAGSRSIITHAKEAGFTVEELIAVGLVGKRSAGFTPTIAQGLYVYPHTYSGAVLFFSLKDPSGELRFQIRKKCAGPGWLAFNQDSFDQAGPVVIVEGENDLLSVVGKGGHEVTVATIGNYNTPSLLSYLKANAGGKTFFLCFDNDDAGRAYTQKYSGAIIEGGGEARVIVLPEGGKDIDDHLKAAADPAAVWSRLMAEAIVAAVKSGSGKILDSPGTGPKASTTSSPPDNPEELYQFDSFEVLGELVDGRLVFLSKDIQKLHVTDLREFNLDKLCQIGGDEIRKRVVRSSQEVTDGRIHFAGLKKRLICEAREKQLGKLRWIGQGFTFIESQGTILILNGEEAALWDGKKFSPYTGALIDQKFINRDSSRQWIDFGRLQDRVLSMTASTARDVVGAVGGLIKQWGFTRQYDPLIVAGFLLSQIVQSVWEWRPHLWVSGPAGSGKTLLIQLFEELAGRLARRFEGPSTTEPGFRQSVKNDFVLVMIDEFEKTPADTREELIAYLRTAGRGGPIVKGTPGQESVEYVLKHSVLVTSIETGQVRAAEQSRFLVCELEKDIKRDPKIPSEGELQKLRLDFFALSLWACLPAKQNVSAVRRMNGQEPRLVEAFAVPLSMMCCYHEEPSKTLSDLIIACFNERREGNADEDKTDEGRLLEDILSSTCRVAVTSNNDADKTTYTTRSMAWLLGSNDVEHWGDLEAHGLKLCDGGFFIAPQVVLRQLLQKTIWVGLNIGSILRRLPGATNTQRRLTGQAFRGVFLPDIERFLARSQEDGQVEPEDKGLFDRE
jgi:hypothetical protein